MFFSLSLCVCKTIHYITYYLLVFLVLCFGIQPPSIAFTVSVVCSQRIRGKKENAKSSVACLVDAKTDESHIKMNCRHTVCEYACIEHIVPANLKLVFAHRNFSNGIKGSAQPYFRKIFSRKQHKNWWSIAWEWAFISITNARFWRFNMKKTNNNNNDVYKFRISSLRLSSIFVDN